MRISDMYSAGIHGINQVSRFLTRTHHRKQQQKRQPDLALRYTGTWSFVDPQTKQKHEMTIGRNFTILIDHKALPGRIIGLDGEQLVFLDHYGFQLKVFANHLGPVEIYDESSDQTYPVINHRDQPYLPPTKNHLVDEDDPALQDELIEQPATPKKTEPTSIANNATAAANANPAASADDKPSETDAEQPATPEAAAGQTDHPTNQKND